MLSRLLPATTRNGSVWDTLTETLKLSRSQLRPHSSSGDKIGPLGLPLPLLSTASAASHHGWNKAVSEAERLVGFPTTLITMKSFMTDELAMASHVRKLMGTDHPILKTIKRLVYSEGRNNVQVRGLMILLLCRALNSGFVSESDFDQKVGVLDRQRQLAECVEMIFSAEAIHKSVLNLPPELSGVEGDLKEDMLQLEYGNKIAILGGDHLLAKACVGLANLRNPYVVELVSIAISDFTQSAFMGRRDVQGRMIPTLEHTSQEKWIERNTLAHANLMARGCKSAVILGKLKPEVEKLCERLGYTLSMALQLFSELQPFTEDSALSRSQILDLSAAPVLFHIRDDPKLLSYIHERCGIRNSVEDLDFKKVYEAVISSGKGIQLTRDLLVNMVIEAQKDIAQLEDSDASRALKKMLSFLK